MATIVGSFWGCGARVGDRRVGVFAGWRSWYFNGIRRAYGNNFNSAEVGGRIVRDQGHLVIDTIIGREKKVEQVHK